MGPLPLYVVAGAAPTVDFGLTMREWGEAGDPRPARMLFGAAGKLQLSRPTGPIPGLAMSAVFDRFNDHGVIGVRTVASTGKGLVLRFAGFAGAEAEAQGLHNAGLTAGIAVSLQAMPRVDLVAEALLGPRGGNLGGAVRWAAYRSVSLGIGANYLPREDGFRIALTVGVIPARRPAPVAPIVAAEEPDQAPTGARLEERPRFRVKMKAADPARLGEPRHLQHGPFTARVSDAAGSRPPPAAPVRGAAPSLEDLAEAQLREQEALAEARERRVRSASDQLDAREKALLAEARRLAERERELAAREQLLDAREKRIGARGAPTQQQRDLELREHQLRSQERTLAAQERSFAPAIDAAQRRERDAASREDAERREAARLAAATGASSRAAQLDARKQALAARNRHLTTSEARLAARDERLGALEHQLRARAERLDTWERRLEVRAERLDLLERRASAAAPPAAPKPADAKEKAAFVMVVKSPTSVVKEPASAAAATHTRRAVDKAVAAAAVVTFASPAIRLSDLDRKSIDEVAKVAAREQCELHIWARAQDPSLIPEAQRRAGELRARAMAAAPLTEKQIVTRITTRPSAQGVDAVISALRDPAPLATPAPAATRTATLEPGEAGKRQIRESVLAAQPSIEACVAEHVGRRDLLPRREGNRRKLRRLEGVLKLTLSPQGRVARLSSNAGELGGADLEECLGRAAASWIFPASDSEYAVDVPLSVIGGGAR